MKFNLYKLNALAVPRSPEVLAALNYRRENSEWLKLSSAISLKVRKILRLKGISQVDLANLLSVLEEEIKELLSGKVNLELKTIAKFQTVLKEPIIEVNLLNPNPSG